MQVCSGSHCIQTFRPREQICEFQVSSLAKHTLPPLSPRLQKVCAACRSVFYKFRPNHPFASDWWWGSRGIYKLIAVHVHKQSNWFHLNLLLIPSQGPDMASYITTAARLAQKSPLSWHSPHKATLVYNSMYLQDLNCIQFPETCRTDCYTIP